MNNIMHTIMAMITGIPTPNVTAKMIVSLLEEAGVTVELVV